MNLIKTSKKIIHRALRLFGIQVSIIPRQVRHKDIILGKVGDFNLLMNADHSIVRTIALYPSYCANLPRLAQIVKEKYQDMSLIDVGANIGDGIALIRTKVHCPIVCIEGDRGYFELLQKNIEQFKDVSIFNEFLGEKESNVSVEIIKDAGTLRIQDTEYTAEKASGDVLAITTLDSLARTQQQRFSSAKILKIDTDGYDLKIIRGAKEFIKKNKPVLFFEYDRVYLDEVNDDGLSIFNFFKEAGYHSILFYDNYGRFLVSTSIEQLAEIEQLDAYISGKKGHFQYYDLCVFHKEDTDIAQRLIEAEVSINRM